MTGYIDTPRSHARFRRIRIAGAACVLSAAMPVLGYLAVRAMPGTKAVAVSQRGRAFGPDEVSLAKGQALTIANDDGNVVHHAYVDAKDFSFDSGDQEPGSRTPVTFDREGTFQVLCGIHPRMRMTVRVR